MEAGAGAALRTRKPGQSAHALRTLFPLTAFKNARNPKFVRNLSQRLFLGVPVRGTEIWKNLSKFVRKLPFFKFRQIFPNFSPPDWNPQKQSLGQISDKFGVSGVFEGCKGEKGSQHMLDQPRGSFPEKFVSQNSALNSGSGGAKSPGAHDLPGPTDPPKPQNN